MAEENNRWLIPIRYGSLILVFLLLTAAHFFLGAGQGLTAEVFSIRLHVYLAEIGTAAVLACSGLILQTLLANPLAEPYVLGVSGGASLGAVLAIFLSLAPFLLFRTLFALVFSAAVSMFILAISTKKTGFSIGIAVLAGVALNSLFSGLIMLLQSLFLPNDLQSSVRWLMGNLDFLSTGELILLGLAVLLQAVFLLTHKKELDIYLTGEEMAQAVGVDTAKLKREGFLVTSVSAGIAVSLVGMIGFVGLIVPHIVRFVFGRRHGNAFFPLVLVGSVIMIGAGVLAKMISPGTVFPVGIITSLIGAPFFILLLLARYKGV